ncbi:SRR1-like protein BER1 isoform X2 [Pseudomyrmex gracilis]|uniref:SRR1-like protein BER1 isoform X2 n=1 Tax=Pseudomyrmex gracilis TaxID=219809 RepID=UPI00099568CD|nr:SRR1-like protein BER1 isoform X2 [Pseudomyrmex gracilis]
MKESSEFILVTHRRRKSGKSLCKPQFATELRKDTEENSQKFDYELYNRIIKKIHKVIMPSMSDAKYTNHVIEVLDDCLTNLHYNGISEIICYGLGNLSENKQARYQLGLLLCLRKYYDDTPVYVYDPVFSSEEKKILQYFGLQIINRNEEEIKLKNLFEYDSAFSSQSVHFFTKKKLRRVPIDFWKNREEPQYLKTYENLCPDCSDCIQEEKLKKKKTKKKKNAIKNEQ